MDQGKGELITLIDAAKKSLIPSRMTAAWIGLGAAGVAVLASACCWLPLLLVGAGFSGGAMATTFVAWRPVLLPVTFILLGAAFYFTHRKPSVTSSTVSRESSDSCCAFPSSDAASPACCPPGKSKGFSIRKFNKILLWVVTLFVLAFAFFPNYIGFLYGAATDDLEGRSDLLRYEVHIEGMTCESCAIGVRSSLMDVPGVEGVDVSYRDGLAIVFASSSISDEVIIDAVEISGYSVNEITQTNKRISDIEQDGR